jgi:hypothetical protein
MMQVKDLIKKLQECNPDDSIIIIQEEELECMSEWWDDEKGEYGGVSGAATEIYSEDLHSHQFYLLGISE